MASKLFRIYFLILIIGFGFTALHFVHAQAVPPPPPSPGTQSTSPSMDYSDDTVVKKGLISFLKDIQLKGTVFIKHQLDILQEGFNLKTFLVITFFSLAYGIFHTLGPGHGKLIVVSFFLRDNTTRTDAFSLSLIVSIIHSSSAIILAILFQTILSSVKGFARLKVENGFTLFSGLLISSVGVIYLIRYIVGKNHKYKKAGPSDSAVSGIGGRWRRNIIIGLSIGIVPCPLSLTIMMLSILYGIFWIGITSVISLTIVMVIVLYLLSVYTIKSREIVEYGKNEKAKSGFSKAITASLNYTGNIALILLGIYFIYKGGIALF